MMLSTKCEVIGTHREMRDVAWHKGKRQHSTAQLSGSGTACRLAQPEARAHAGMCVQGNTKGGPFGIIFNTSSTHTVPYRRRKDKGWEARLGRQSACSG